MAVKASAICTKTLVTTTVKTHSRVTFARPGYVWFVVEGFGTDATDPKFIVEVYRGSSSGTPGSNLTARKLDSADNDAVTDLCTITDVFSNETSYSAGQMLQRPTLHTQHNRQTIAFKANASEVFDIRLTQDTGGDGLMYAQVTVYVQG